MAAKTQVHRSKTLDEIRADLSEEMDRLGSGEVTPAIANARVNLIAAHLRTYKLQIDYARLVGKTPNIPMLLAVTEETDA